MTAKGDDTRSSKDRPRRTAFLYALAGALWIVFSDYILELVIANQKDFPSLQTVKGLFYVIVTAALLYFALRFYVRGREREAAARGRLEAALIEREEQYRQLFESNPHPMWVYDTRTLAFLIVNDAAVVKYGYSREEFLSMSLRDIRPPEDVPDMLEVVSRKTKGFHDSGLRRHRLKGGGVILVDITAHDIPFYGRPARLVLAYDITTQVIAERALRQSEERLRLAVEAGGMGTFDLNVRTGEAVINDEYALMLEYLPGELHETNAAWRDRIHADDRDSVYRVYEEYIAGKRDGYRVEFRQRTKTGRWKWILSMGRIAERDAEGRPLRMLGIHVDLTERVKAEEEIRRSLREKEILIKEIHHRVKNNLQVISSILSLQERFIESDRDRDLFRDSRRRVWTMAMVHEKLYSQGDLARVDFDEFLKAIAEEIRSAYPRLSGRVEIILGAGSVPLDVNRAVPCAQIVGELVTNAARHAFPGERTGEIRVSLGRKDGRLLLRIADNGIGLPDGFVFPGSDSLGLTLVNALVEQIGGVLEREPVPGTSYVITFG